MRTRGLALLLVLLIAVSVVGAVSAVNGGPGAAEPRERSGTAQSGIAVVVIDPGHGGDDFGARGASGALEKRVVLQVAQRVGAELEEEGFRVIYTRKDDSFVTLADRTEIANRAQGDLFLSFHANSAPDEQAAGIETYFLSLDASDEEAQRVAQAENGVFGVEGAAPDSADIVGGILGDMIRTRNLAVSSEVASAIQKQLGSLPGASRGVKQAPFVVLMGVNMPAVLIETGFLTNPSEERRLGQQSHQKAIARAVAQALRDFGPDADADADADADPRDEPSPEPS